MIGIQMTYEEIIEAKRKCYEIIEFYDKKLLEIFKYYKGDLLPLINCKCRKNMTCGDIDCVQWDFYKKIFRIIECKRIGERQKPSQNKLLDFFTKIKVDDYKVEIYKIIGNPPFESATIIDIKNKTQKVVDNKELLEFLNLC